MFGLVERSETYSGRAASTLGSGHQQPAALGAAKPRQPAADQKSAATAASARRAAVALATFSGGPKVGCLSVGSPPYGGAFNGGLPIWLPTVAQYGQLPN